MRRGRRWRRHRGLRRVYQHRDRMGRGPRPGRDEAAPCHADARQSGLYGDGGTEHATAAWLSSQPGNRLDNVHRSHQHSLFLAHVSLG